MESKEETRPEAETNESVLKRETTKNRIRFVGKNMIVKRVKSRDQDNIFILGIHPKGYNSHFRFPTQDAAKFIQWMEDIWENVECDPATKRWQFLKPIVKAEQLADRNLLNKIQLRVSPCVPGYGHLFFRLWNNPNVIFETVFNKEMPNGTSRREPAMFVGPRIYKNLITALKELDS